MKGGEGEKGKQITARSIQEAIADVKKQGKLFMSAVLPNVNILKIKKSRVFEMHESEAPHDLTSNW